MKKTLLLTSLVASMVAMAGTTGTLTVSSDLSTPVTTSDETTIFQIQPESASEVAKDTKLTLTPKVVLDMKVKDTGFGFGGEFLFKELKIFNSNPERTPKGNVWAKYELPEIHGVKSYVKGTFDGDGEEGINLIGELDLKYDYKGYMLGLNSKTTVPLFETGDEVTSTHTASVSKEKVSVLSDVKGSVAVKHAYTGDAFKSVEVKAEAQYKEVKDLNVKGEVAVKYNKETDAEYKSINGLKTKATGKSSVLDTYKLTAEYKGVKNLTLTGVGEIKHFAILDNTPKHLVEYGLDLKADYMPIENLTLTANGLFYGQHNAAGEKQSVDDDVINNDTVLENNGYVKLVAGAKYAYKVTNKFTITPEGTVAYTAANIAKGTSNVEAVSILVLTPKVSAEYKISDALSLGGSVETPVEFSNANGAYKKYDEFDYENTTVKTNLNLKYTW